MHDEVDLPLHETYTRYDRLDDDCPICQSELERGDAACRRTCRRGVQMHQQTDPQRTLGMACIPNVLAGGRARARAKTCAGLAGGREGEASGIEN